MARQHQQQQGPAIPRSHSAGGVAVVMATNSRSRASEPTGYIPCGCRDCFEIAIGAPGSLCSACKEAGCDGGECLAQGDPSARLALAEINHTLQQVSSIPPDSLPDGLGEMVIDQLTTAINECVPALADAPTALREGFQRAEQELNRLRAAHRR